jgi:hypothetical protein
VGIALEYFYLNSEASYTVLHFAANFLHLYAVDEFACMLLTMFVGEPEAPRC